MEDTRCANVGLGGGARNATKNSLSKTGEEGVTIIAGKSAFSGKVRSVVRDQSQSRIRTDPSLIRTQRGRNQRVVEPLRQTVKTRGYTLVIGVNGEVAMVSSLLPAVRHGGGRGDSRERRILDNGV